MNPNSRGYEGIYREMDDRPFYPHNDDMRRREDDWNSYPPGHSPPRNIPMDYPDSRRRREFDDRGRGRDRSPIRERRRDEDYRRDEEYRRDEDYRRYRRSSPKQEPFYRRESRMDYGDRDDRRRSPEVRRERSWMRGACSTVVLRNVPDIIEEYEVRNEVKIFGAPVIMVRMEFEQGPSGSNERVCVVEFEGTRDATEWMQEHQGVLRIENEKIKMEYRNEMGVQSRESPERSNWEDNRRRDDDRLLRDVAPSDTMIVKGLDRTSTEEAIRKSFEYITHFPITDIRLVRDKFGVSRGFCFVQWKSVEDCKQVLEYLRKATPRFHIDGKHVSLEFSTPQGAGKEVRGAATAQASKFSANIAGQVAEAAIQAAHWSREKDDTQKEQKSKKENLPAEKEAKPANTTPATEPSQAQTHTPNTAANLKPGQYPTPDTTTFQYDSTSGFYYDSTTGLYYDAKSRYFYNSFTGQYLMWDQSKRNYLPVSNEVQKNNEREKKEKDQKEQKEQKKLTAKKIAKDMERWAKAQNKKKEEFKKLLEDSPTSAATSNSLKKESSTADTAFFLLGKQSTELERQAAVQAVYREDPFKRPDMPVPASRKPAGSTNSSSSAGLVSYMKTSDSESDEEENEEQIEEKLIDWNKLACLLCRRGFPSKDMLQKHKDLSDLHKTNLEQRVKNKTGSLIKPKGTDSQPKYRDRAAERRKNFGSTAPPAKKNVFRAPVPFEQPTKHGLDETNIGNQMLQKMGWNKGRGLGKSQSGRTDIIEVKQRSRGVGLGMKGASYGLDAGDGDYRTAAKKITQARYLETD